MRHKAFVSVVVYVRDEEETVAGFLRETADLLSRHFELYEVVVVDDASRDRTVEQALAVAEEGLRDLVLVELARRHGVEAGIQAGLERALGDWVFELESSATGHPPHLLVEMFERASVGFDVVTAADGRGSLRSRLFYRVVNRYADLDRPLRTERVRLTSRRTLNTVLAMKERVRYRKALYAVTGARHAHVDYPSPRGRSGGSARRRMDRETTRLALDVVLSCSGFGLRLAHRLSFLFGSVSVAVVAYAAGVFLLKDDVVEGWTTVTVVVSGGFAGLFLVLGVLGEYLARILVEVRGRPLYAVRAARVFTPTRELRPAPAQPRFLAEQAGLSAALVDEVQRAGPAAPDERVLRLA